ncbi:MAG: hypothetical protein HYW79_00810 [Parcubacteria group bacterium]|nr:hypothetical protein [Parcubacteria group bacterium]
MKPESVRNLKEAKEGFYGDTRYESERARLVKEYGFIEDAYNSYIENKMTAKEFADALGGAALGVGGRHPSSQVYAYELLIKSLAEAPTKEDADMITQEIIFDTAVTELPIKKEYFLGILAHYGSHRRESRRAETMADEPKNIHFKDEANIFETLSAAIARLQVKGMESEEIKHVVELVQKDFPEDSEEGEVARLIAKHYEKEPHATRIPEPSRRRILDTVTESRPKHGSSGEPNHLVLLRPDYHTSQEKVEEAHYWGIPLLTHALVQQGEIIRYVILDTDPQDSMRYIKELREAYETNDSKRAEQIKSEYRDKAWDRIDDPLKQIFGRKENLRIQVETIRDHSIDEVSADESAIDSENQ